MRLKRFSWLWYKSIKAAPVQCILTEPRNNPPAASILLQYEGTFDDYLEMFIQFGYVILFSSAYPLAGLCALVNNLIEIRGDAFKLCLVHKRPFGQRVNSIGTWQVSENYSRQIIASALSFKSCVHCVPQNHAHRRK